MKNTLIIVLIATIALGGCTSMRPIDAGNTGFTTDLKTGDHLVIYEQSGRIVDMTYSHTDGNTLKGALENPPHFPVTVAISDIRKIDIEKVDGVKTTFAVVGGTIVVVPLLAIAALAGGLAAY